MKKRFLCLVLAVVMLCAMLPQIPMEVSAVSYDVINVNGVTGETIVDQARKYLGVPYDTSGGNYKYRTGFGSTMMFDCSGFVYRVCRDVGLASSRKNYTMGQTDSWGNPLEGQDAYGNYYITAHTQEQRYYGEDISAALNKYITTGDYSDLRPGDLLFLTSDNSSVSHVVIYAGNGKIVHSEGYHGSVVEHPIGRYPTSSNWYFDATRLITGWTATEGYYTYSVSDGEASIVDCDTSISGTVTIPSKLGGYPVTTIGEYAFDWCDNITAVSIPNSVTTIGVGAFSECTSLTEVTLGDSVTTIGLDAFSFCDGLTSVKIPDSVTTIDERAFYSCDSLTSVIIGNGVTTIGSGAFSGCGLTSVIIPDSVFSIGSAAFRFCDLKSVIIPRNVKIIGELAFNGCENLEGIWVDENNTDYNSDKHGALFNNTTLVQVPATISNSYKIPDGITDISCCAFYGCSSLKSILMPDSVRVIGDTAFAYCSNLITINIPAGVTDIDFETFIGCTSLGTVSIPVSVTSIGEAAFFWCDSLTDVYYAGTRTQWNAIEIYDTNENLTDATIHFNSDTTVHKHVYQNKVTKPTCTAKGYTTYTCSCGDTYKANATKELGHSYKSGRCIRCKYKPAGAKITTQPVNVAVGSGKTAKVTVKATGSGLKYTWYYAKKGSSKFTKDSVTSASYSVKMSSSVNGRKVYCVVTDKYGNTVKSNVVTLYKGTAAKIKTQPKGVTVASGKTGKLTIKASGSGLSYTWYAKNKGASSFKKVGKSSKTYSFEMSDKMDGAQVYCVVKDKYGITVKSAVVTIKLAPKAKITTQPKNVTVTKGKTAKVTLKATGDGLKYTWYYAKSGSSKFKKASGKSSTYSVKMSAAVNGRRVYCVVKDKYENTVKSSIVTLKMK